jgi:hypothetical protein
LALEIERISYEDLDLRADVGLLSLLELIDRPPASSRTIHDFFDCTSDSSSNKFSGLRLVAATELDQLIANLRG